MLVNRVVVFPDADTTQYFKEIFKNCPFSIDKDLDNLYVTLNETKEPVELDPARVYQATAGSLGYWYDLNTNSSSLILPLDSPSILTRMAELRVKNGSLFHPQPLAFMTIKFYMPPLNIRYRTFVSSVSEMLNTVRQPLIFTGETQAVFDYENVPDALYYEAQL